MSYCSDLAIQLANDPDGKQYEFIVEMIGWDADQTAKCRNGTTYFWEGVNHCPDVLDIKHGLMDAFDISDEDIFIERWGEDPEGDYDKTGNGPCDYGIRVEKTLYA